MESNAGLRIRVYESMKAKIKDAGLRIRVYESIKAKIKEGALSESEAIALLYDNIISLIADNEKPVDNQIGHLIEFRDWTIKSINDFVKHLKKQKDLPVVGRKQALEEMQKLHPDCQLIYPKEILNILNVSYSQYSRLSKTEGFPKPVYPAKALSSGSYPMYKKEDILAWINAL